jgi:hypothetical protein
MAGRPGGRIKPEDYDIGGHKKRGSRRRPFFLSPENNVLFLLIGLARGLRIDPSGCDPHFRKNKNLQDYPDGEYNESYKEITHSYLPFFSGFFSGFSSFLALPLGTFTDS